VPTLSKLSESLGKLQVLRVLKSSLIVMNKSLPLMRRSRRVSVEVDLLAL
jgi:hypothetical protein